jgi:hypothetical protein
VPKWGRLVGYHRYELPVFIQVVYKRPRGPPPGLVAEVPRAKYKKMTRIIYNTPAGHSETKSKHLTRICMWAQKYFFGAFFISFWAISGREFFWGGIIYSGALDLKPTTLNLRPALLYFFGSGNPKIKNA